MNFFVKLAVVFGCYAIFHAYILRPYIAGGVCTSRAKLERKTVLVTGANTGIGKETALDLAKRGARVIMVCRNLHKAEAALKEIVQKSGNKNIVAKRLDLASLKSVREFAEDVSKNEARLDVLINNAGILTNNNTVSRTEDGFETHMRVNHLGHFLLTNLLLDLLKKSAPSRIVVVSSATHNSWGFTTTGLNFENMNGEIAYIPFEAYGQSKLANILFTRELARRLEGTGVTANSLHPGSIKTDIGRDFPILWSIIFHYIFPHFAKTSFEGAQTTIHLAVSEELDGVTGLYFVDCKEKRPGGTALDEQAAKKLWEVQNLWHWTLNKQHSEQPRSQGLRGETVTKTLVKFVLSFQNFGEKIACAVRHNRIQPLLQYGCVALRMRFFPQNFGTIKRILPEYSSLSHREGPGTEVA